MAACTYLKESLDVDNRPNRMNNCELIHVRDVDRFFTYLSLNKRSHQIRLYYPKLALKVTGTDHSSLISEILAKMSSLPCSEE